MPIRAVRPCRRDASAGAYGEQRVDAAGMPGILRVGGKESGAR